MKRFFNRLYFKYLLWIRKNKFLKPVIDVDPHENIYANICRKLMSKPNTKFSLAPLSEKRYIINEELGMFITIEPYSRTVELTNHVYHYFVKMNDKTFKSIVHIFDNKLEDIRLKYENEVKDRIQHSLHIVLDKLNN